jgi:hypothetical protein
VLGDRNLGVSHVPLQPVRGHIDVDIRHTVGLPAPPPGLAGQLDPVPTGEHRVAAHLYVLEEERASIGGNHDGTCRSATGDPCGCSLPGRSRKSSLDAHRPIDERD